VSQTLKEAKHSLISNIKRVFKENDFPQLPIDEDPIQGDLSIICFPGAPVLKESPEKIATIVSNLVSDIALVKKVSVVKAFCNIDIDWDYLLLDIFKEISEKDYGRGFSKDESILVEHTSANATGPFHMGRARNPIIGDSISRLLKYNGYDVTTEYYVNDTGRQAATVAFGIKNFEEGNSEKQDHKLVECYRQASDALKSNEEIKNQIYQKMELIESGNKEALAEVKNAAEMMLSGMRSSLKRLNAEADSYFHESDLILDNSVNEVISSLKKSNICVEEQGAFYLDLGNKNIAGRNQKFFFTRNNGLSLYTTRDIAYHLNKFERFPKALNILGEDHKLQSTLLNIALDELESSKPDNLFYSFVNLPGGKMSTRAGRVVYLDDMMEKIVSASFERLKDVDMNLEQKNALAEKIGIGSLRYNILKVQPEKGFTFSIDDALSIQGDSAPFAMYSHARMCSIIKKYGRNIPKMNVEIGLKRPEIELIRIMAKWPQVVELSATKLAIHKVPNYIHQLASQFNNFYRDCKVIGDANESLRINLVFSAKKILFDALEIIGIAAPERM
tara:strand:+ start:1806 stop:3485 length:1680 start_codon:yes stop_codon:yes gene_type:complete